MISLLRHLFIALSLISLCSLQSHARPQNADAIRDSLQLSLSKITNTQDSLSVLFNLFDIGTRTEQSQVAYQILDIAERIRDRELGLEFIRHISNIYTSNDSILADLQARALKYPDSRARRETLTFLSLIRAGYTSRYLPDDAVRHERIKEALEMLRNEKLAEGDIYDRIERLGTVCILLSNGLHPGLLQDNIERLVALTRELPAEDIAVRNFVFNQTSRMYTDMLMQPEAISALRDMVRVIDRLKEDYQAKGRIYRGFDTNYYTVYRMMLQNYEALSQEEVDDIYGKIQALAKSNSDIASDMRHGIAEAYYRMAKGQYAQAIPMLIKFANTTNDTYAKRRALRQVMKGADYVGDKAALADAAIAYNKILEDYLQNSTNEVYSEMQVIYDVNNLKARNAELERQQIEQINREQQRKILIGGIILGLLLIIISLLLWQRFKVRKMLEHIKQSNGKLSLEKERLEQAQSSLQEAHDKARKAERFKGEFISNMSSEIKTPLEAIVEYSHLIADCVPTDKNNFLHTYSDIITINAEQLRMLINDTLELGSMDEGKMSVQALPSSVNEMCKFSVESVRRHVAKDVQLAFIPRDYDSVIITDARRVEQVLVSLLNNAAKFTEKGSITLSFSVNSRENTITFAVTDTGCGIPEDCREKVFERFYKVDKHTQGAGLGLSVCRMIADLMQGSVTIDPEYTGGTRMLFTIPMN